MDVMELISEELCNVKVSVKDKTDVLQKVSKLFAKKYKKVSAKQIFEALMEREKLGSTGFGDGLAIPHAKLEGIDSFGVVMLSLKKAVEFQSIDRKKVKVVIAIVGPVEQQKEYLRLLAAISKNIKNTNILAEMAESKSKPALIEAFAKGIITLDEIKESTPKKRNKLLVINLREQKYFDDIIHHLLEEEISDAIVTDSQSVESFLADSPLFSGFLNFLAERSGACKTIMVAVNEEQIPIVVDELEAIMGDLDTHTGVQVIAFDISFIKGAL